MFPRPLRQFLTPKKDPSLPAHLYTRIQGTNYSDLGMGLYAMLLGLILGIFGNWFMGLLMMGFFFIPFANVALKRIGYYDLGRASNFTTTILYLLLCNYLTHSRFLEIGYIEGITSPMLFKHIAPGIFVCIISCFDWRLERHKVIVTTAIAIVILAFFDPALRWLGIPLDNLPFVEGSNHINVILFWGNLAAIMMQFYFLQFAFEASQRKAAQRKKEISAQNEELASQRSLLQTSLQEIQDIVGYTVTSGYYNGRLELAGKEGHWKTLSQTVNELFESMGKPLQIMAGIAKNLADGNFVNRLEGESKGEIAELSDNLNASIDSLNTLLLDIKDNAAHISRASKAMVELGESVTTTSMEITTSMDEINAGASSQLSQVDQSSTLMRELVSLSEEIDKQSHEINDASLLGVEKSENGVAAVVSLKENIQDVNAVTNETVEAMNALNERIGAITQILSFMNDISAQTNLLALNAAIEAAQAGESGRGFGIIAEEIRKLADDSKKSVSEIEELVAGVKDSARTTDLKIQAITKNLEGGKEATEKSSVAFEQVATSCRNALEISKGILTAAQQQSEKASVVMQHIQQVVVVAEETATGTERARSATGTLSSSLTESIAQSRAFAEIADKLNDKVSRFKLKESTTQAPDRANHPMAEETKIDVK